MSKEFEFISEEELLEIDGGESWLETIYRNYKNSPGCVKWAKLFAQAFGPQNPTSTTSPTTWRG